MTVHTDVEPPEAAGPRGLGAYVSGLHATWLDEEPNRSWRQLDGTLLFADVSGFTPLAERLARQGKVGAEQLTDTLNTVFAELLAVAGRFGGDCLKFGGDALLLAYTGGGHERRGAAAAFAMQRALRSLRRRRSGAGLANLGISMGVRSGAFHAFLTGHEHRELILAGPGVSRTLELEGAAAGGQVLLDRATSSALDPGDVSRVDDVADLLRRAPTAALHPAPVPAAPMAELGIPAAIRPHLDGHPHDGEHRLASVAFVKFGGSDSLLEAAGPAALSRELDRLVRVVQDACRERHVTFVGSDVDVDGGKLILAAGVPSTSSDDEDRLLLAVREIVEAAGPLALTVRAGVHRGRVFAVDLGGPGRRTFTVMGDAVNLAARVMGRAAWGTVVATDDVLEPRRIDFALEALEPFTVKGKSEPVQASVLGPARGRRGDQLDDLPLIGRSHEVDLIREAFTAAQYGEGRIVELIGEPGIGKSKLVQTVTALDHGLDELVFEAGRYSLATPYFALRRGMRRAMGLSLETPSEEVEAALRDVVASVAPHLVPWLPLLGVPLGLDLPDTPQTAQLDPARRHATLETAAVDLMGRVLRTPTLIRIEDAHWLDAASCDLLRALLADVDRRPWAVLVTRRDVGGGLELDDGEALQRCRLQPLAHRDLAAMADAAASPAVLELGVRSSIIERCGGNPLFLQELVRASVAGSVTGSATELPETIEAVVAATIDTLPPPDRSLLRHAAILGGHLGVSTLALMVGSEEAMVKEDVDRLHHFLQPAGAGYVRFRHILLRDVAYEGLPFRVRRAMHERAGEILERSTRQPDALAELLSIHFGEAQRHAEAWHYSRLAGERAQRNGASVEAAAFFERSLAAARHVPEVTPLERAEVAERLGDSCELGGRYGASTTAYRLARRLGDDDPLRQARLCRKIGYVRDHEGRYAAAQRWFTRGLRELDGASGDRAAAGLRAELRTAAVSSMNRQGRHGRAEPLIQAAVREAEASGDRAALARAYFVYDQILANGGRYAEATHSEAAAAIYEELGDHRGAAAAYNEMGNTAYWLGRWDDAVRCYERAIAADERAGAIVYNAIYLNNIGEIRSDQGRLREAEVLLQDACALWTSGGWRAGTGWALSNLGRLSARAGRFEESAQRLAEARDVLTHIGAEAMLVETDARDLERLVLAGDHERALATAPALLDRAEKIGLVSARDLVRRLQGCAVGKAGDRETAWQLIEDALGACRSRGAAYDAALAAEALGRLGAVLGRAEAAALAAEAAATFARLGVVTTPAIPGLAG